MRKTYLSVFLLPLLLLMPMGVIAGSDSQAPQTEATQVKAVAEFYNTILTFKGGGFPSKNNIDRLSPLISKSFRKHLLDALAGEPRSVEGALFYSLFEGADRMKEIVPDSKFGPNSFLVALEKGDPKKGKDQFTQWQDRAVLVNQNGQWVVDDLHLLGGWQFGAKGKLSEILNGVAKVSALSNTVQLPETSAASRAQLPADYVFAKGKKIYLQRTGQAQAELWTHDKNASEPSLSPSGKVMALTLVSNTKKSQSSHIAIQDSPSSKPRIIYGAPGSNFGRPIWSPDGELIMFDNYPETGRRISVINKDGTGYRDIVFPKSSKPETSVVAWGADGKSVYAADWEHLYHVRLNGELIESIPFNKFSLEPTSPVERVSLHPDGQKLLVAMVVPGLKDMNQFGYDVDVVFLLDLKMGKATRVSPAGIMASRPIWLPDGKSFLFTGTDKTKSGIYQMDIESRQIRAVVQGATGLGLASQSNPMK